MSLLGVTGRIYLAAALLPLAVTAQTQQTGINSKPFNGDTASSIPPWTVKSNISGEGHVREKHSSIYVPSLVFRPRRPAEKRAGRSLMPLPPPPPGMESLSPAVKDAEPLELENFWKNFPTLEKQLQTEDVVMNEPARITDVLKRFRMTPQDSPITKIHTGDVSGLRSSPSEADDSAKETSSDEDIADVMPVENEPMEVELLRMQLKSNNHRHKHAAKKVTVMTKNVSSVESNSVPPSTSTSTSTTPATATIEEDLITSSSVIDDGDSTNLSTTSVEARTSSSSSEFLATPTFPAVKIMAPESVSSEEESSTTLASAVLLPSTHPQLTTIIAASTTAIGIETSKRDSQMATRAKTRGYHWTGRSQFRSAAPSGKRPPPDAFKRRSQPAVAVKFRSATKSNLLDLPSDARYPRIKMSRGENSFKPRKSEPLLFFNKGMQSEVQAMMLLENAPKRSGVIRKQSRVKKQRKFSRTM